VPDAGGLGCGIGLCPFDTTPGRSRRWAKLITACVGSEPVARHLTALWNLDWGHEPNERNVPPEFLSAGLEDILSLIAQARPRLVVPLSNRVAQVIRAGLVARNVTLNPVASHLTFPAYEVSFPRIGFPSVVIKPPNHPSRHFLTDTKIALVEEVAVRYR
jgi:hypothetical protein